MSKKILVPMAQGFEETELISVVDVLRRAKEVGGDLEVITASLNSDLFVKGSHDVIIKADYLLKDITHMDFDAIALAGGYEGMNNLKQSDEILNIIKKLHDNNKILAAICASPIVLNAAGVLKDEFTCYPGCEIGLNGTRINQAVVANKNIITSAGPATAILFGLELAKHLCSNEIYGKLYEMMLVPLVK
ncbi:DJ-1/PfpI family protein [Campylobacter sp. W0018]|uniref:DJ-1 family glyoxalase III n=1 Tax=Campylobacter sp. W0018 TaxID=2735782 RepID=UPI00301CD476|nr:DJ-1/PfpI family protein [Campylobacter sp. W0018]